MTAMKEQLAKFKTQYDVRANYDHKGLFEAKKVVYKPEIQRKNNIEHQAQQQFTLEPLDIGFLQSLALKDDPKFIEIQKIYAKYNAQTLTMKQNPADGLHLKKVVMNSMLKFLRMMMLAPDSTSKKTILDMSYYWLMKHLNPKMQRKTQTTLLRQIKQLVSEHNLLPKAIIQRQIPSTKLANDLYEYRIRARTQHSDLDAPQFQLQNYHIHKVTYMSEKVEADDGPEEKKKKRLARVKFQKPNLDQYYIQPEEELKEEDKIQIPIQQPPLPEQDQKPPDAAYPGAPEGAPPPEQPPENAELAKQMELLNQMGGEPDQHQEAPLQEDEDKKKGKLDPLVKVFIRKQMLQKEKEGSFQHPPINQLERYRNNYKEALQREDEIFSRKMNEWASHRCRFKTQVSRKLQSIKMYHNQTVTLPQETSTQGVFYQTRINEAIRDGKRYLKQQFNRQPLNSQGSLSCFDRRRAKTLASSTNKPFSKIIQENRRSNMKQDSLVEIEDIKQKFAKKKIFTSMQAMKGGLMHPEERSEDQELEKIQYPVSLLSNPFFPKKKKKKGKKKKK